MNGFDLVIGYEDIKRELLRVSDVLRNPEKYDKLVDVGTPHGILLYGDHGVGKSLMAECFIRESGLPMTGVNMVEPGCEVINEIRVAFAVAAKETKGKAIVFLDNLDDDADANRYAALKACMDGYNGEEVFVLATAKDKDNIPEYLLRAGRFDKVIEIEKPCYEDAVRILKHYLSQRNCAADVDVEEIAGILRGDTCAELELVVNEAGIHAVNSNRVAITQQDLIRACLCLAFASPETTDASEERELLEAAVHEAGHVVAGEILVPGSVMITSVSAHTGGFDGVTCVNDDKNGGSNMKLMEARVIRSLAGKAASEIVLGIVDTGCADDLANAFTRVERMVDNLCACGFDAYEGKNSSETLRARKDQLVASKMTEYYKEAKRILAENRAFLDKVTEELMERKTLTRKDIQRIRAEIKG